MTIIKHAQIVFSLSVLTLMIGCSANHSSTNQTSTSSSNTSQQSNTSSAVTLNISVTGRVTDGTSGLGNVDVTVGQNLTVTDSNGFYKLDNVAISSQASLIVTFARDNYTRNSKIEPVSVTQSLYNVNATLAKYDHVGFVDTSSSQTQSVALPDPANPTTQSLVSVSFPNGSIPATGKVKVSVVSGDPTSDKGKAIFPGDYIGAASADTAADTLIESVAFTEITLTDENGNRISALNSPATITLKLPDALQAKYAAGDTIPWWSYDETKGAWVREDADPSTPALDDAVVISKNGVLYGQASVKHFTWWNLDHPITEHSCICVQVEDKSAPLADVDISAQGVSYQGTSLTHKTDSTGQACVTVKRSLSSTTPEKVALNAIYGGYEMDYVVTDASEGVVNTNVVNTPTVFGSTISGLTGTCSTVKNKIIFDKSGELTGTVKNSLGNPVANYSFYSSFDKIITTDANGNFSVPAYLSAKPVYLYKPGEFSTQAVVDSSTSPVHVDIMLPNKTPWIQKFTSDVNPELANNQTINFSVLAVDPEGGNLNYSWQVDSGLSIKLDTTHTQAQLITPATGMGVATITLSVTDASGAVSTDKKAISWGMSTTNLGKTTHLKFVFLDSAHNPLPEQGITVAMHDANGAITQELNSDANGMVDVGDVGNTSATFSIYIPAGVSPCENGRATLTTYVGVSVGTIVYYLNREHPAYIIDQEPECLVHPMPSADLAPFEVGLKDVDANTYSVETYGYAGSASFDTITPSAGVAYGDIYGYGYLSDSDHRNRDAISMLAVGYDTNGVPLEYGFLDHQHIYYGETLKNDSSYEYDFDLNRPVETRTWYNPDGNVDLSALYYFIKREGFVMYEDTNLYYEASQVSPSLTQGDVKVFPDMDDVQNILQVDYSYGRTAYFVSSEVPSQWQLNEQNVPYLYTNLQLNGTTINWTNASPSGFTYLEMTIRCTPDPNLSYLEWKVWLPGDASSWPIYQAPSPASTCTQGLVNKLATASTDTTNTDYASARLFQYGPGFVSNVDEYWKLYLANRSPEAYTNYYVRTSTFLPTTSVYP